MHFAIVYVCMLVGGIGLYFAYTRLMPQSWLEKLAGFKTKTVGAVVTMAPDLMTALTSIQSLGIEDWAPGDGVKWSMRIVGILMIVLRFISDKENKD